MRKKRWLAVCLAVCALIISGCANDREAIQSQSTLQPQETQVSEETAQSQSKDGRIQESQVQETESEDVGAYDFTICFAGDMSLDENAGTTELLDRNGGDITACISSELIARMRAADLMCVNNEFTYSLRGKPTEDKMYTFRANPARVTVLQELGVDLANLANNHVYDYGEESILDTLATLEEAGIAYVGAGHNLNEAMSPYYVELGGKTVAFVAASRAEKYRLTPQATEDAPGILRCYDTELFLEEIRLARENADFVIAIVHWGTEYSYELEEVQLTTAREYLDARADAIIGGHSHCLQGMEYYDGKPILYSLGNYWFNRKTLDTMLIELHFWGDKDKQQLEVSVIPAIQKNCATTMVDGEDRKRIFDLLESISVNTRIDEAGVLREVFAE